ncbi:MAG TPA: N-acetylmuramoyl-L-alanine amidase [Candidatus Acidoferrales bacterium]|nr:N-acetylmuramoyl-L-alanine amidase [Candidatus Acidoferrales bacterium]
MTRRRENKFSKSRSLARGGGLALVAALLVLCPRGAKAQGNSAEQAEAQYQKAEQMRGAFTEAQPADQWPLSRYKQLVAAYRRVYLLSSSAGAVTPALMEVGELYHEMGDQFDQAYYQNALATYKFLISQYPGSKFRAEAIFQIGKIEKENVQNAAEAKDAFGLLLKTYPRSERVAEARVALKEINEGKLGPAQSAEKNSPDAADDSKDFDSRRDSSLRNNGSAQNDNKDRSDAAKQEGQENRSEQDTRASAREAQSGSARAVTEQLSPEEKQNGPAEVTAIRTWNADDYTRVVVDLNGDVQYQSARIKNPDRIYFDLYKAQLAKSVIEKELPVQDGFLKAVRVAQNDVGVVRLVLDVNAVEGYSAFLLPDPYRLVIDVHGNLVSASDRKPAAGVGIGHLAGDAAPSAPGTMPPLPRGKVQVAENDAASTEKGTDAAAALSTAAKRNGARVPVVPAIAAKPMHDGDRTLTRALGLKINRIVIDPGHGGHDTGTIGPGRHPLMEKDVCLDVALRLGKLIHKKLPGAEVVYTRTTDVFVPLEERTAIANQAKADLFISIHANASRDKYARGIETYYLNFTTSQDALETASRENAVSNASIHELQDFIKKIARNDKIEESRELASDIQTSLTGQMRLVSTEERNRGVKKAPFVVLIGADMPSVLAEISFLSNPTDENLLRKASQKQRIAQGIFRGVEQYLSSLNSLAIDRQKPKLLSDEQSAAASTPDQR